MDNSNTNPNINIDKKKEAKEIIEWLTSKINHKDIKNKYNKNYFSNYYSNDYDLKDYNKYYNNNDIDEKLNKMNNYVINKYIWDLNDEYVQNILDNDKYLRHMVQSVETYRNSEKNQDNKIMYFESGTNLAHSSYLYKRIIDDVEKNKYKLTLPLDINDDILNQTKKGNYNKLKEKLNYDYNLNIFTKENKNNFYKFCKQNS